MTSTKRKNEVSKSLLRALKAFNSDLNGLKLDGYQEVSFNSGIHAKTILLTKGRKRIGLALFHVQANTYSYRLYVNNKLKKVEVFE